MHEFCIDIEKSQTRAAAVDEGRKKTGIFIFRGTIKVCVKMIYDADDDELQCQ